MRRHFVLLLLCTVLAVLTTPLYSQRAEAEFKARIDARPPGAIGTWEIGGRDVDVTAATELDADDGPLVVGACVQVKGTVRTDGVVEASNIKTEDSSECSGGTQNGGGNDDGTPDQGGGNDDDGPGGNGGDDNDEGEIEFKGVLGDFPTGGGLGTWTIGGRNVEVTAATILIEDDGPFVAGRCVEVKAQARTTGLPEAVKIETESPEDCRLSGQGSGFNFKGLLQSFPDGLGVGVWQIGGRMVTVTDQTVLITRRGSFVPNACIEAEGFVRSDGTMEASKLQTESPDDCGGAQQQNRLQDRVRFRDRITMVPPGGGQGEWQFGSLTVTAVEFTRFRPHEGPLEAGACADVKARRNRMALEAEEIRTERDEKCDIAEDRGDRGELKFFGTVDTLPADDSLLGDWMVDGTTVTVSDATRIEQRRGPVEVGSCVEVEGDSAADGSITAREIEVKSSGRGCLNGDLAVAEVEFRGLIQQLPDGAGVGEWLVAGRTLLVTAATELQFAGTPAVGECVKVHGSLDEDAVVVAREIEPEDGCGLGAGAPGPEFEITGPLEILPDTNGMVGNWTIDGITVAVIAGTERNTRSGAFGVGACVKAQGSIVSDGTRQAREVETRPAAECGAQAEFEIQGLVQEAPTAGSPDWTIGGITVATTPGTEIDERLGPLVVGACARVEGRPEAANRVLARQIQVLNGSGICASSSTTVGAASLRGGAVSPGQILSVFGLGVGPASDRGLEIEDDRVTRQLGATRVLFEGEEAPLLFASAQQINLITPMSLQGKTETEMEIETEGGWSQRIRLEVRSTTPGLFTLSASGMGQAAALNTAPDGSLTRNGPGNAIPAGGVLVLYANGLGPASQGGDGQVVDPTGQNLPQLDSPVKVTIGGVEARVLYAGGAPGLVLGLWQINAEVPEGVVPGAMVPVTIEVNGVVSQSGVTVAVQ